MVKKFILKSDKTLAASRQIELNHFRRQMALKQIKLLIEDNDIDNALSELDSLFVKGKSDERLIYFLRSLVCDHNDLTFDACDQEFKDWIKCKKCGMSWDIPCAGLCSSGY